MSRAVVRSQEVRSLLRDYQQLVLLVLFVAICAYAVLQGAQYRAGLEHSARAFHAEQQEENGAWRDRVVAMEAGDVAPEADRWAGLAMDVTRPAVADPGLLADFSKGISDVQPYAARVSLWRSIERLFGNYQFQNPQEVRAGQVDLSFVVLFVMPLLMIAMGFGVLSEDRDSGRLGLVLSQPVSVRDLVIGRLAVRLGVVLGIVVTALLLALVTGQQGWPSPARVQRFLIWTVIALIYFSAWSAVIFWGVSLNRRGESLALLLIGIWALNTLAGPAIISSATQAIYPAPSQLSFLSKAREASSSAYRSKADVMQGMLLDHPELNVDNYSIPEYIRTSFLVSQSVDRSVQPVLEEFDRVQGSRRRFLDFAQYLAPAAVTMRAMNLISGTDLERQVRFEREVREYKLQIADYVEANVLSGERLTVGQIDRLPEFEFRELRIPATMQRLASPLIFLTLIALLFGRLGNRNFNRLATRIQETP